MSSFPPLGKEVAMTWAVNQPQHRFGRQSAQATGVGASIHVGWTGMLTVLLGAWAGIVAFVGPAFGYRATTSSSWQWTTTNWLLHLVPGAMAVAAGLVLLGLVARGTSFGRGLLGLAALAVVVAGAWLVIGPALWPWFESSAAYGPFTNAQTSFANQLGANLGPGVLLAVLGGMALKETVIGHRVTSTVEPEGGGSPVA
jgi:hypothetical protein